MNINERVAQACRAIYRETNVPVQPKEMLFVLSKEFRDRKEPFRGRLGNSRHRTLLADIQRHHSLGIQGDLPEESVRKAIERLAEKDSMMRTRLGYVPGRIKQAEIQARILLMMMTFDEKTRYKPGNAMPVDRLASQLGLPLNQTKEQVLLLAQDGLLNLDDQADGWLAEMRIDWRVFQMILGWFFAQRNLTVDTTQEVLWTHFVQGYVERNPNQLATRLLIRLLKSSHFASHLDIEEIDWEPRITVRGSSKVTPEMRESLIADFLMSVRSERTTSQIIEEVSEVLQKYRLRGFPLDVFVCNKEDQRVIAYSPRFSPSLMHECTLEGALDFSFGEYMHLVKGNGNPLKQIPTILVRFCEFHAVTDLIKMPRMARLFRTMGLNLRLPSLPELRIIFRAP